MTTSTYIQIYFHDFYLESPRRWWNFTLHVEIPDWLEKRLNKGLFLNIQHIQFSLSRSSSLNYVLFKNDAIKICNPSVLRINRFRVGTGKWGGICWELLFYCFWKHFTQTLEINVITLAVLFPHSSVGKEFACNAGNPRSIPGWGRSPGEGNGNLLQYSCLEIPMDRGTWHAIVHGVARVRHDLATKP